jgi:hypothetical protein
MKALMLAAWLSGCGADGVSTAVALYHGAHEVILTQSTPVNTAIIGAEASIGVWDLNRLYRRHPKLAVGLGVAAGVGRSLIAVHNVRVGG